MRPCEGCGRQVGEDFAFCPYCGAPLPTAAPAGEQRKRVTVLFCDVTGSTALGESTDPEALRALLARYFHRMKGIIEAHGGTVEKFIGDAVMAVFGVPVLHEDDALRAARAALQMQSALPELGVTARIGIQSGEVVTGTEERLATGDAVNVAARLEQAAEPGEVLMGEETLRLVRDAVEVEAVAPLALKGKSEPVSAFRLLAVHNAAERRQISAPMIGRERELRRLQDSFAQAVEDRSCQLFTVLGSAGVGKSRLIRELLSGIDEGRIVRGRCLPYGEGITYFPVTGILTELNAYPTDSYAAAIVQSLLGEREVATSPDEIAWAVRSLLEEQSQERPLIVVFDDIHWGEETFLDLVEHIADLSRDAPILLLCMARPELLEKRPAWGGGKWNATTILLEPLDAAETDQLVDALGGLHPEIREQVRQAAEGNPLFVEEMLLLIEESGTDAVVVPPTIQALLGARLDQLTPDERHVLQCGAVEGRAFHRSALQAMTEENGSLQQKLVGLVRKELVRRDREQLRGDEAYRFRHLLIRDAAYEALPKSVRADLHERFAGWLEAREGDLPELDEIVGYHLEQAARYRQELGRPNERLAERAGELLARAGREQEWARGDFHTARILLERALALLRPLRWNTYLEMELLAIRMPHFDEMARGMEEIADGAREARDGRGELVARARAAHARLMAGRGEPIDDLERMVFSAVPSLESVGDHEGLFILFDVLREIANIRGHFEEYAHASEQMIQHARCLGRPGIFFLPAALMYGPRPADDALRTLEPLVADDPHPGPPQAVACLRAMLGQLEGARMQAESAVERHFELSGEPGGWGAVAAIAAMEGDHEACVSILRRFCDVLETQGSLAQLSTYLPLLGRELCTLGRYEEAEPLAIRGRELGGEGDIITQSLWRQTLARVLAWRGEHPEAERLAREAVAIVEPTDALLWQGDALFNQADVLEAIGRSEEAATAFREARERYSRKRIVPMVAQVDQRLESLAVRFAG